MAYRGDSATLPHIKFLWNLTKKFASELCSTQVTSLKMLGLSIVGVLFLPAISRLHVAGVYYQTCAVMYYGCMYIFTVEATHNLFRILEYHRVFFCCGSGCVGK